VESAAERAATDFSTWSSVAAERAIYRRGSIKSAISSSVNRTTATLKRSRSIVGDKAWKLLEDTGHDAYWWGIAWTIYVICSVIFPLTMTQDPPLLSAEVHAAVETVIEVTFALELIFRGFASHEIREIISNPFNINIDNNFSDFFHDPHRYCTASVSDRRSKSSNSSTDCRNLWFTWIDCIYLGFVYLAPSR